MSIAPYDFEQATSAINAGMAAQNKAAKAAA